MPAPADVSLAELALGYEAFAGRAFAASPDHRLRGARLPLGERAQVLRRAAGLVERHLVAGMVLCGAPLGRCRALLTRGGGGARVCKIVGPFFAARHELMLKLMRLATHCRDWWVQRLRAARMRPPPGDRSLMDYYPPPLATVCQESPRAPPMSVPLAALQRSHLPAAGSGTQGALCLENGVPSCPRCKSLG